jgi:hypothetical protein
MARAWSPPRCRTPVFRCGRRPGKALHRGIDPEELDASTGQDVQQLDDVELVDQRVRQVDERSGHPPEISHDLASTK